MPFNLKPFFVSYFVIVQYYSSKSKDRAKFKGVFQLKSDIWLLLENIPD